MDEERERPRCFTTGALQSRAEKRNKAFINIKGLSSGPLINTCRLTAHNHIITAQAQKHTLWLAQSRELDWLEHSDSHSYDVTQTLIDFEI